MISEKAGWDFFQGLFGFFLTGLCAPMCVLVCVLEQGQGDCDKYKYCLITAEDVVSSHFWEGKETPT